MTEKVKAFDYTRKRTRIEALKFYIACVIMGVLVGGVIKSGFAFLWGEEIPKDYYQYLLYTVAFIYTALISLRVLYCKRLWSNTIAVFLAVLGIILAVPFGLLTGFIPISILMTFEPIYKE